MEYTADFAHKLDQIIEKQTMLEVSLGELRASIKPRHEIDGDLEKRVSLSTYLSDKAAMENRIKNLEDVPSANWTRGGIILTGGIGCLSLLISGIWVLITILIATHVIG